MLLTRIEALRSPAGRDEECGRCFSSNFTPVIKRISIKDFFKAHAFLFFKKSQRPIDLKAFQDLTPEFQSKNFEGGIRIG